MQKSKSSYQIIFLVFLLGIHFVMNENNLSAQVPYDLENPDFVVALPDRLLEVSDLAFVKGSEVACVQDEKGDIFIYDIDRRLVVAQYEFSRDGDYEGIAVVDSIFYILRSDGRIYEIVNYDRSDAVTNAYTLELPSKDNEGLCADLPHSQLLIAPKSKPDEDYAENKKQRFIHTFSLDTKQPGDDLLIISLREVERYIRKKKIQLTSDDDDVPDPDDIRLKTSAIDIHPISGNIYMLSAEEFLMLIFSPKGKLLAVESFDPSLHFKPEGICFLGDGRMVISNEGGKKPARIVVYSIR